MTPSTKEIAVTKAEISKVTQPVLSHLDEFRVILTADQYAQADFQLSRIRGATKAVDERMEKLLDPINEVRKQTLALKNELLQPLEMADSIIRDAMKGYKLKELAQKQEEERRIRDEQERLQREAEAIRKKEEAARTNKMRERLAAQRTTLEEAATRVTVTPVLPPVRVAHSSTRTVKKARITNHRDFINWVVRQDQISSSDIEMAEFIDINTVSLNAWAKDHPDKVAEWPGVQVYDDVIIVGERQK